MFGIREVNYSSTVCSPLNLRRNLYTHNTKVACGLEEYRCKICLNFAEDGQLIIISYNFIVYVCQNLVKR